jgi:hypothetical protein
MGVSPLKVVASCGVTIHTFAISVHCPCKPISPTICAPGLASAIAEQPGEMTARRLAASLLTQTKDKSMRLTALKFLRKHTHDESPDESTTYERDLLVAIRTELNMQSDLIDERTRHKLEKTINCRLLDILNEARP